MNRPHPLGERRLGQTGAALVTVLILLTILTVMVVGMISMTSMDRDATHNYAMGVQAEQIALGGIDRVVSQLVSEATDAARNTINGSASNALYLPSTVTYSAPARMSGQSSQAIMKYSRASVPLYSPSTGNLSTNLASASSTATASINGRSISVNRWNKPQLLESTTGFVVPDWVYVSRNGPVALAATTNPTAQTLSATTLRNNSAIIGRYAYIVYDTGGLLDITVAGHPSNDTVSAAIKGAVAWADLTQLNSSIGVADVDQLVAWRNAAQTSSYAGYIAKAATNGFLKVYPGDNTFLGRQDLIKYAAQNTAWKPVLPYLTTFSRAVNGPTWAPAADASNGYKYKTQQFASGSINPFFLQARVGNTAWTRWDGSKPVAGEPLLKSRFPLNKLALLEKMQGVSSLSSQDIDDIARYFGLDPVSDSNGYYRHWNYPTTNSKYLHTPGQILTLDQVAALTPGREPDLFELLQAAILDGSTGTIGRGDGSFYPAANGVFKDPDSKKTFQILRIGANIIDQYSADNYPTTITLVPSGDNVYGVQDLPYINKIYLTPYAAASGVAPFEFHLYYELWNPHQAASVSGVSPTQFRLIPFSLSSSPSNSDQISDWYQVGFVYSGSTPSRYWMWNGETGAWSTSFYEYQHLAKLPSGGIVPFTVANRSTDYRTPSLVRTGSPSVVGSWSPSVSNLSVLSLNRIPDFPKPSDTDLSGNPGVTWPPPTLPSGAASWNLKFNYSFVYCMQFQDSKGVWRTYGTFAGSDNSSVPLPGSGARGGAWVGQATFTALGRYAILKSDPRTYRFAHGFSINTATVSTPSGPADNQAPFVGQPAGMGSTNPYRVDYWAINDSAVTATGYTTGGAPYYSSLDGVQRPGDARYTAFPASGPQNSTAARPIVLNRPFQSVGELGYVFRDEPWKTLDLFSAKSGDSALLDLFSVSGPTPISAGTVNPNTPYYQVVAALLSGAEQNAAVGASSGISSSTAKSIAQATVSLSSQLTFSNRAEFVSRLMADASVSGLSPNKCNRESVIRALAESANTRTWNLMIDVIAQAGTYSVTATKLDDFVVSGERRYWLHVAIDRYTGKVVDSQLEIVTE